MAKRSSSRTRSGGHPPEVEAFIDWQRHQYLAHHDGRRLLPGRFAGTSRGFWLIAAIALISFGLGALGTIVGASSTLFGLGTLVRGLTADPRFATVVVFFLGTVATILILLFVLRRSERSP